MNGKIKVSDQEELILYFTDEELANLVISLIEKGYAFTDEPAGWPPAAIVQNLKGKGLVQQAFTAITWCGSNDYKTYEIA